MLLSNLVLRPLFQITDWLMVAIMINNIEVKEMLYNMMTREEEYMVFIEKKMNLYLMEGKSDSPPMILPL